MRVFGFTHLVPMPANGRVGSGHDLSVIKFQDLQVPAGILDVGAILIPLLNAPLGIMVGKVTIPVFAEAIQQDDGLAVDRSVSADFESRRGVFLRHDSPGKLYGPIL